MIGHKSYDLCGYVPADQEESSWFKSFLHFNPNILRGLFWILLPPKLSWQCSQPEMTLVTSPASHLNGMWSSHVAPMTSWHRAHSSFDHMVFLWLASLKSPQLPMWSWKCIAAFIWSYRSTVVCLSGSFIVEPLNWSSITWGDSVTVCSLGRSPGLAVRGLGLSYSAVTLGHISLNLPIPVSFSVMGTGIVKSARWMSKIPSSS